MTARGVPWENADQRQHSTMNMGTTARAQNDFTVEEVAGMIGVSEDTIYAHIHDGILQAYHAGKRGARRPTYRIRPEDVEQFRNLQSTQRGPRQKAAQSAGDAAGQVIPDDMTYAQFKRRYANQRSR